MIEDYASSQTKSVRKPVALHVIRIVADNQELGFAEKVQVVKEKVLELCKEVVHGSVEHRRGDEFRLHYESLNGVQFPCVGFYGDKNMVMETLAKVCTIDEPTLVKMKNGDLEAGIYVVPLESSIVVFYWHEGDSLREGAARNNVSCTFIRYVVELCDVVFVFAEDGDLSRIVSSPSCSSKRERRTTRLHIQQIQNSSNDVEILRRFSMDIESVPPSTLPQASKSTVQNFLFAQGSNRCAFLNPIFKKTGMSMEMKEYTVSVSELPTKLEGLMKQYCLDFSKLSKAEFLQFLQCSGLPEFEAYNKLVESSKTLIKEEIERFDMDIKFREYHGKIIDAVMSALCSVSPFLHYLLGLQRRVDGSIFSEDPVEALQKEIKDTLCSRKQCFAFFGSEIMFQDVYNNMHSFVIISIDGSSGPLYLGQEFGLQESIAYFTKEKKQRYLVESDETVTLHTEHKNYKGKITNVCTTRDSIVRWIAEQFVSPILKHTEENLCVLRCVSSDMSLEEIQVFAEKLGVDKAHQDREIFMTILGGDFSSNKTNEDKISQVFLMLLTSNLKQVLFQILPSHPISKTLQGENRWISDNHPNGPNNDFKFEYILRKVSYQLCERVQRFVCDKVKKYVYPYLELVVKEEKENLGRKMEEQEKDKREAFLGELKKKVYKQISGSKLMSVTKFWISRVFWHTKQNAHLSCMVEGGEKTGITWMLTNVSPKNKDLDELAVNPMHHLILSCSRSQKLFDMDMEDQELKMIVYTKSGEVLAFVFNKKEGCLDVFKFVSASGYNNRVGIPIKRGYDLIAFEESTRFLALYEREKNNIKIYKIDEKFQRITNTGVEVSCDEITKKCKLKSMIFISGKNELLIVDAKSRIRVVEFSPQISIAKPKHIELSSEFTSGCVSRDGSFLFVLQYKLTQDNSQKSESNGDSVKPESSEVSQSHDDSIKPHSSEVSQSQGNSDSVKPESSEVSESHVDMKPQSYEVSESQGDSVQPHTYQTSEAQGDSVQPLDERKKANNSVLNQYEIHVYLLEDSMCLLKSFPLGIQIKEGSKVSLKLVYFGNQSHLVIYSETEPSKLFFNVLRITSASEELKFSELSESNTTKNLEGNPSEESCLSLDYLSYIFEKFAVDPPLSCKADRNQNLHVILRTPGDEPNDAALAKCKDYLKKILCLIEKERGKDFSRWNIVFDVHEFQNWEPKCVENLVIKAQGNPMGDWIRDLVCLVPVQICRAHNNVVEPLVDGLHIPPDLCYDDSISLATLLKFGMYDSILKQWKGKIKVISSMGKQSSGKSFLLNHLSGSLLDVAGGRCTDGVWLTLRRSSDCMYVLLDFEGLGSFERSEQEDMLLSVLNAAVSNLTIFNKKDFNLDKETESVFQRFQDGASLFKNDEKLFKGLLYIAIKDVDVSDVEELKKEFRKKLLLICQKSKDNFLTKMYGGSVAIAAMFPFNRAEYYNESIDDIAATIEDLPYSYQSGGIFLRDLKLVISQIAARDWTPVDTKRIAMKVELLQNNMSSAVRQGCLSNGSNLINFDTEQEVDDIYIKLEGVDSFKVHDTGLMLASLENKMTRGKVLEDLRSELENVMERKGNNNEEWHGKFESFLSSLVARRNNRVKRWIESNTSEFLEDNEVKRLFLEANVAMVEVNQGLTVCGSKCSKCFWRCVLEKGHSSESHSCKGAHSCCEKCTFCSQLNQNPILKCKGLAGHEGDHDCKTVEHTCGKSCFLSSKSSNCNKFCKLTVGHQGKHVCSSSIHTCNEKCSLPGCYNSCTMQIEKGDRHKHICHDNNCPSKCIMPGCPRSCSSNEHFHQLHSDEHLCGGEHACQKDCEAEGICEIFTELVRQVRNYPGTRGTFQYEHLSEQNGVTKKCCIPIPPFQKDHKGKHLHSLNPDVDHYCNVKCKACGYYCRLPIKHVGVHNTAHGNMRELSFSAEKEKFDIGGREYAWGESGIAEMCNMHCKAQGRGHIHLVCCPGKWNTGLCNGKFYEGARHETIKYGPQENVPKDELNHETYWRWLGFEDPCTQEEQNEFGMCDHYCKSKEHVNADGKETKSYCTQRLWHPTKASPSATSTTGYATMDGHTFTCMHDNTTPHHVIFVIDRSGSMGGVDMQPRMAKFLSQHRCRLGCVYEAISKFITARLRATKGDYISVILFHNNATLAVDAQPMTKGAVDRLLSYNPSGGTNYAAALTMAQDVLYSGPRNTRISNLKPVIIFLSDGENNGGDDPTDIVVDIRDAEPGVAVHTIMFGSQRTTQILEEMALHGNGTFQHSLDQVQLTQSFENLTYSLKSTVAALI